MLPERSPVLLGTLRVFLVVPSAVEDLRRLLGGEVLLALHGLALATLAVTLGAVLPAVLLCARAMSPSTSHYKLTQDKKLSISLMGQIFLWGLPFPRPPYFYYPELSPCLPSYPTS